MSDSKTQAHNNKLAHGQNANVGGVNMLSYFNLPKAPSTQPTKKIKVEEPIDRSKPLVTVGNLTFNYFNKTVLRGINLNLMPGQRCLLIGANGAGKSTFLRVLAGKHMPPHDSILSVLGTRAPQDQNGGLAYLGNNWSRTVAFAASNVAYQCDITVAEMSTKLQAEFPERRNRLVELLGINLNWRMHQVSDGQRRRVQIMLGLIRPFKVLFMDEITVDLDICARQDLLRFLRQECEQRGAAIVYATHILDGLADWVTHCMHLETGGICTSGSLPVDEYPGFAENRASGLANPLLRAIETKMRADRKNNGPELSEGEAKKLNQEGEMMKGKQGGYQSGRLGQISTSSYGGYN
jgi:CCR4-NOT complex subunit CAF16